jgi:hypothetical protein
MSTPGICRVVANVSPKQSSVHRVPASEAGCLGADTGGGKSRCPRDTVPQLVVSHCFVVLSLCDRNSFLVDPASSICLSLRLSHACLSINKFVL